MNELWEWNGFLLRDYAGTVTESIYVDVRIYRSKGSKIRTPVRIIITIRFFTGKEGLTSVFSANLFMPKTRIERARERNFMMRMRAQRNSIHGASLFTTLSEINIYLNPGRDAMHINLCIFGYIFAAEFLQQRFMKKARSIFVTL